MPTERIKPHHGVVVLAVAKATDAHVKVPSPRRDGVRNVSKLEDPHTHDLVGGQRVDVDVAVPRRGVVSREPSRHLRQ
eukprot:14785572-Heterocapsa_arctica.AAC.1